MASHMERLHEALRDRYAFDGELGRGGMATVYLARDLAHEREVAIKVLHPDLGMALGAERFRREIEIESRLDHPNILGIHDSGEAEGLLWYAMPYVRGESLRARMDREGQLQVEDAVRIAADVASALDYAHGQGILHRDVKPENILLEDGKVLVADFGIARAVNDEAGQRLTQTGVTLGTPVYMSPEQSFAERDLDGRSDLYSLGCVLYEMLAGTPPFTGPNAQAITARHHMESVPSVTVVRPSVSDEIEDLIYKALAKSRADRCSTGEFGESLRAALQGGRATERRTVATRRDPSRPGGRRVTDPKVERRRRLTIAAAALLLVGVTGGGGWAAWRHFDGRGASVAPARSVAVLYFNDLSAGGKLGHIADGLTEELIADLAQIPALQVASRDRVMPFRGGDVPLDTIVQRLAGTELIVNGRVQEDAGNVSLSVELVDGGSGATREPRRFTLPADSALALRDSLVQYVRTQVGQELRDREQRYATRSTEAWLLVKRAENAAKRAEAQRQSGDTTRMRALYAEADSLAAAAAALDPRWPTPEVLRGSFAQRQGLALREPDAARPWLEAALRHAERAVTLGPRSADALELRGAVTFDRLRMGLVRDTAQAREVVATAARDLRLATEQPDASATAWVRLSDVSYRQLNTLEANRAAQKAYEKDAYLTAAPEVIWRLFVTSYDLGQAEDAQRWCATGYERFPTLAPFTRCQLLLMTMPGARPDPATAWTLVQRLDSLTPPPQRAWTGRRDRMLVGAALGRAGMADSARQVLVASRADARIDPRGELQGLEAFARTIVGDREEAISLLEGYLTSYPEHREGFVKLNTWWWQDIRSEPRFVALVRGG